MKSLARIGLGWLLASTLVMSGCTMANGGLLPPADPEAPFGEDDKGPDTRSTPEVPMEDSEPPAEIDTPEPEPEPTCNIDPGQATCTSPLRISGCNRASVAVDTRDQPPSLTPSCASMEAQAAAVIEFTPLQSGRLFAEVVGAQTGGDSVLFARSSCAAANEDLACNDDSDGLLSALRVPEVQAGVPVYLIVQGYDETSGDNFEIEIEVRPPEAPLCVAESVVEVTGAVHHLHIDGAGAEHIRVPPACSARCTQHESGDAVLRYVPPTSGMLTVSTDNMGTAAGLDTTLAVFANCAGLLSPVLACDDNAGYQPRRSLTSTLTLPATAGVPIFVGVDLCRGERNGETNAGDVEVTFDFQ